MLMYMVLRNAHEDFTVGLHSFTRDYGRCHKRVLLMGPTVNMREEYINKY